ncbi:MAG: glycosyltransferase family 2 protein [Acidobacteriota bacterium]|nr:glycosyltransferase family 2 protein [Acidobacteriota bacterium]
MEKHEQPDVSVVVPIYNEAENLSDLHREISEACRSINRRFEFLFIDDGSTDSSFAVLKDISASDPRMRVIRFRKNFGQTAAISAGFEHARGEIIITMDADLQNDPADFARLLEKIEAGFDVVSGWRQNRKDRWLTRRIPSMLANRLISRITGVKLHDYGCTLKAFRREVVKNLSLYGEMHRFIPAIASSLGIVLAEIPVNHRPRRRGRSKYTIFRAPRVLLDLMTVKFLQSYSTRPLQIFGLLGFLAGFLGAGLAVFMSYERLFLNKGLGDRPLLLLAVLLIVIGFQFITLGLLAEIMIRTYHESSHKKTYHIKDIIGPDSGEKS